MVTSHMQQTLRRLRLKGPSGQLTLVLSAHCPVRVQKPRCWAARPRWQGLLSRAPGPLLLPWCKPRHVCGEPTQGDLAAPLGSASMEVTSPRLHPSPHSTP